MHILIALERTSPRQIALNYTQCACKLRASANTFSIIWNLAYIFRVLTQAIELI